MVVDLEVGCVRLKFGFVLPPLIEAGGGLVCESVGKVDMLSAHFDGKQSRDLVDLPSTCHPSPSLTYYVCLQVTGGEAAPAGSRFLWFH